MLPSFLSLFPACQGIHSNQENRQPGEKETNLQKVAKTDAFKADFTAVPTVIPGPVGARGCDGQVALKL